MLLKHSESKLYRKLLSWFQIMLVTIPWTDKHHCWDYTWDCYIEYPALTFRDTAALHLAAPKRSLLDSEVDSTIPIFLCGTIQQDIKFSIWVISNTQRPHLVAVWVRGLKLGPILVFAYIFIHTVSCALLSSILSCISN